MACPSRHDNVRIAQTRRVNAGSVKTMRKLVVVLRVKVNWWSRYSRIRVVIASLLEAMHEPVMNTAGASQFVPKNGPDLPQPNLCQRSCKHHGSFNQILQLNADCISNCKQFQLMYHIKNNRFPLLLILELIKQIPFISLAYFFCFRKSDEQKSEEVVNYHHSIQNLSCGSKFNFSLIVANTIGTIL